MAEETVEKPSKTEKKVELEFFKKIEKICVQTVDKRDLAEYNNGAFEKKSGKIAAKKVLKS